MKDQPSSHANQTPDDIQAAVSNKEELGQNTQSKEKQQTSEKSAGELNEMKDFKQSSKNSKSTQSKKDNEKMSFAGLIESSAPKQVNGTSHVSR